MLRTYLMWIAVVITKNVEEREDEEKLGAFLIRTSWCEVHSSCSKRDQLLAKFVGH
jgi:hypothetical protein